MKTHGRYCKEKDADGLCDSDVIRNLISYLGDDWRREGLVETPKRYLTAMSYLCRGYSIDMDKLIKTFKKPGFKEIVLLKDIEMYSLCEHHLLPFFGKAHVAYLPRDGVIIGISKLARIVDAISARLQTQENICDEVTTLLMERLEPLGAACVIKATHLCMRMRGTSKQNSMMITSSVKGLFLKSDRVRAEFFKLIEI